MLREGNHSGIWTDINQNREMIQVLADLMSEPLCEENEDGYLVLCNRAFLDFFGVEKADVINVKAKVFFSRRTNSVKEELDRGPLEEGDLIERKIEYKHHDGTFHLVKVSKIIFHDVEGAPSSLMTMFKDLTKQRKQEREYAKLLRVRDAILEINNASLYVEPLDQLLEIILEKMLDTVEAAEIGTFLFRDGTGHLTIRASRGYNQSVVQDFQLLPEESFLWKYTKGHITRTEIIELNPEDNLLTPPLEKETSAFMIASTISAPVFIEGELYGLINVDSAQTGVFKEEDREVMEFIRGQIEGVINRKRLFEQSQRLSHYDLLTQIYNRRAFEKALRRAIEKAEPFYLIMFDLDGLKWVNDSFGHQQGDRFLTCMADQLRMIERAGDTIARFGGDEFVAICYRHEREDMLQELVRLEESSQEKSLEIDGKRVICSFSYGLVQFPQDGETEKELIREVDSRMYKYKRKYGRGR